MFVPAAIVRALLFKGWIPWPRQRRTPCLPYSTNRQNRISQRWLATSCLRQVWRWSFTSWSAH